jgi:hypothetical protein
MYVYDDDGGGIDLSFSFHLSDPPARMRVLGFSAVDDRLPDDNRNKMLLGTRQKHALKPCCGK